MSVLSNTWKWLYNAPHQLVGVRVLQMCIGAVLLFQLFTDLPFATYFWGPNGIGWGSTSPVLGSSLGSLFDSIFTTNVGVFFVLLILALGACGLVFGYATRVATFLVLMAVFLLGQRLPEITDGGDNITQIVLVYMLFLLPNRARVSAGDIRIWLHNIAVLAILFQVIIMYAASGFAKAMGELWQEGIAMYYVTQVQWFTFPGVHQFFLNPFIVTITTYVPMIYLLLFPVAIISRLKLPWIVLGILFHLGIMIMMGLISFSTVMIGLELFFISDQEYAVIWSHVLRWWERFSPVSRTLFAKKEKRLLPE